MSKTPTAPSIQPWIRIWFAVDAVLFLFPPIYWLTNSLKATVLGMPLNLLYFLLGCTCITASVVAAHVFDPAHRARGR